MNLLDSQRNAASAQLLLRLASEHGMPAAACLKGTRLSPQDLDQPDTLVTGHQELLIVDNLVRRLGQVPALGLAAGMRYHFTSIGALGMAVASSPSLKSAAEITVRYLQLTFALSSFTLEDDGSDFRFVGDYSAVPPPLRQFLAERDFAAVLTTQRTLLPAMPVLRRVGLAFPRPQFVRPYQDFFGVPLCFAARRSELMMDSKLMEQPLLMASEPSHRAAEEQCRRLLAARKPRSGIAEKIRLRILAEPARVPGMSEVAAAFAMTPRTLRRRLLDEATSYRVLCDEVRETLAEELLSSPQLPIERIAERLGYAGAPSFILAFKRWKGKPPQAYRRTSRQ